MLATYKSGNLTHILFYDNMSRYLVRNNFCEVV